MHRSSHTQNMRDGHGAWVVIKAHHCGSVEMEAIENDAENKLETVQYCDEEQHHLFEIHVSMQMKCHLELEKAEGTPSPILCEVPLLLKSLQAAMMWYKLIFVVILMLVLTTYDLSLPSRLRITEPLLCLEVKKTELIT
jgi:hypothetical protein